MMTSSQPLKSPREAALERYFTPIPNPPDNTYTVTRMLVGGGAMAIGLFFFIAATHGLARFVLGSAFFGSGLFVTLRYAWQHFEQNYRYQKALSAIFPQPTDHAVDQWLSNGVERLRVHSLERLGLDPNDCQFADPLGIQSPIPWLKPGLEPSHVTWITGRDGSVRFGIYEIAYLWLADRHLGIFCCHYDLIRDVAINEKIFEYFYQDIVSISVREEASALTLKTGQSLTSVQELRIAVSHDHFISITVGAAQLKELTGAEWAPESGVERALSAIRKRMQDAKEGLLRAEA